MEPPGKRIPLPADFCSESESESEEERRADGVRSHLVTGKKMVCKQKAPPTTSHCAASEGKQGKRASQEEDGHLTSKQDAAREVKQGKRAFQEDVAHLTSKQDEFSPMAGEHDLGQIQPLPGPEEDDQIQPGAIAVDGSMYPASLIRRTARPRDVEASIEEEEERAILEGMLVQDGSADQRPKDSPSVVLDGKLMPESTRGKYTWHIIVCVFVGGLSALLLGLLFPSGDGQNQASPIYSPFQDDLPVAITKFLEVVDHPYYRANAWMVNDPQLHSYSHERQRQRFHLVSFYYHLNGDNWTRNDNWLSYQVSECDWFHQLAKEYNWHENYTVCDESHVMRKLNLNSNNLVGKAPEITSDFLPWLRTFDIGNNQVERTFLPAHMVDLEVLVLEDNKFEGHLVAPGGFFANRARVGRMGGNNFRGDDYGAFYLLLPSLEYYNQSGNQYGGPFSPNIGNCKNMTHFIFRDNLKTGSFPTEIGLLTNLVELDVAGNIGMSGSLPSEMGLLTKLTRLDVSRTAMSGAVPASLCQRMANGFMTLVANGGLMNCSE